MKKNNKLEVENCENWNIDFKKHNEYEVYKNKSFIGFLTSEFPLQKKMVSEVIMSKNDYFIPDYQRGYRWEKEQVLDLLEDIWLWGNEQGSNNKYCLQPIVLKKEANKLILVDGQQRLTTIFIILKAIHRDVKFTLDYETRKNSKDFLIHIDDDEKRKNRQNEDINFYYMAEAYETIKEYFASDKNRDKDRWYEKLTNDNNGAFFIEYKVLEMFDERKANKIFENLNNGKISLTNAELLKALILKQKNFAGDQIAPIQVSIEWDRIEQKLRNKNFWAWLGRNEISEPHIDFIFEIIADGLNDKGIKKTSNYSYRVIQDKVSNFSYNILDIWKKAKTCMMTLEDWYDDMETYHIIGFLNQYKYNKPNATISVLYNDYLNDNFNLIKLLREYFPKDKPLTEAKHYNYFEKKTTAALLFLFNMVTCIKSGIRFNFEFYKKTLKGSKEYDVEHIYPSSKNENNMSLEERVKWLVNLKDNLIIFEGFNDLNQDELEEYLDNNHKKFCEDEEAFDNFYEKIIKYKVKDNLITDVNALGNLTLLDASTNRSYKNAPFPIKVKKIVEIDLGSQETYVLPCTKNVFLKYYSKGDMNNYVWTKKDAEKYEKTIIRFIKEFLKLEGDHNEQ